MLPPQSNLFRESNWGNTGFNGAYLAQETNHFPNAENSNRGTFSSSSLPASNQRTQIKLNNPLRRINIAIFLNKRLTMLSRAELTGTRVKANYRHKIGRASAPQA